MSNLLKFVSLVIDISIDSESDSDPGDSVSDVEVKKKSQPPPKEESSKEPEAKKEEKKTPTKRRVTKKAEKKPVEEDDDDKVKGKRNKKVTPAKEKEPEIKKEAQDDNDDESQDTQEPKGRDFDLNQIRSELKGIDKAVKVSSDLLHVDAVDDKNKVVLDEKVGSSEEQATSATAAAAATSAAASAPVAAIPEVKINPPKEDEKPPAKPEEKIPEKKEVKEVKDDIYEFKEPEPFEYQEVLRPMNRIFDDGERSPEKHIAKKLPSSAEKKEASPFEVDVKSRFRKTIGKKMKDSPSPDKKDSIPEKVEASPKKLDSFIVNSYKIKSPEKEIPVLKIETDVRKSISPEPFPVYNCVQEEVSFILRIKSKQSSYWVINIRASGR